MPEYTRLTDDEILHLAEEYDELTDEAKQALDLELHRRNISVADVAAYHAESQRLSPPSDPGLLWANAYPSHGMGRRIFGKSNYSHDPGSDFEEFNTTLWFLIFWLPVIPLASYTVKREIHHGWGRFVPRKMWIVRKLPRNWGQILSTWLKAAVLLLAVRLAVPMLLRLFARR
jgi:hypothetical protein